MCHLLLIMPLVALPIFWLLPLATAAWIYAIVVALSSWVYVYALKSTQRPIVTGAEEILHSKGRVIETEKGSLCVRIHSEIWIAESTDALRSGDWVKVVGVDGLTLQVRRIEDPWISLSTVRSGT